MRYRVRVIDAHCHLDDPRYDGDRAEVISRARAAGVRGFVLAGVEPDGWAAQAALCREQPDMRATVGLHPQVVARWSPLELARGLEALSAAAQFAIGEIGLDGSRWVPRGSLPMQREAFRAQLALARERGLPVALHVLDAHGHALDVLRRDGAPARGGMVHSYSGPAELVADYEALGFYLSFSGSITRPTARRALEAAARVSPERLLVETDCPDQRPADRDGSRNLPEWLGDVVAAVAAARGEAAEAVAARSMDNARRLFQWEEE